MNISKVGLKNDKIKSNDSFKKIEDELEELISKGLEKDIFLMSKMLVDNEEIDTYEDKLIIAIKNYKILIIDFSNGDDLDEKYKDLLEDIEYYSKTFSYHKVLGRRREWETLIVLKKENELGNLADELVELSDKKDRRTLEILYSLLTSNINDPERIGKEVPETTLEKVKRNIINFDTDQAQFLFGEEEGKLIKIQGLAGTGKTELLLRKLKEAYVEGNRVALTCHNEVLADSLRKRVPEFFNFLKVKVQIDPEKLKCFRGWGSKSNPNIGLYSYICDRFNLTFYSLKEISDFEIICQKALIELEELNNFEPPFDYIFIDEAQDFGEEFIKFCCKLAKKRVYVAGDVFQNIFEVHAVQDITFDNNYLLKKCYRTDPKTLSYAHAISLGLYDDIPSGWLEKEEWEHCGYNYSEEGNKIKLLRQPVNRFEDFKLPISFQLNPTSDIVKEIINVIKELRKMNSDITPDDIGIMFHGTPRNIREETEILRMELYKEFKYLSNFAFETREKTKGEVFISTQNHTKGLEFSFVICVLATPLGKLGKKGRNALYMMLTRSFLTSYLIVKNQGEDITRLKAPIEDLKNGGKLVFKKRDTKELEEIKKRMIDLENIKKSKEELIEEIVQKIALEEEMSSENEAKLLNYSRDLLKDVKRSELEERIKNLIKAVL